MALVSVMLTKIYGHFLNILNAMQSSVMLTKIYGHLLNNILNAMQSWCNIFMIIHECS